MTYEEAHKYLEDMQREYTQNRPLYPNKLITANGIAIEALEKQIRKPIEIINGDGYCPVCGYNYGDIAARKRFHMITPFCNRCGQAIDWSRE